MKGHDAVAYTSTKVILFAPIRKPQASVVPQMGWRREPANITIAPAINQASANS